MTSSKDNFGFALPVLKKRKQPKEFPSGQEVFVTRDSQSEWRREGDHIVSCNSPLPQTYIHMYTSLFMPGTVKDNVSYSSSCTESLYYFSFGSGNVYYWHTKNEGNLGKLILLRKRSKMCLQKKAFKMKGMGDDCFLNPSLLVPCSL